MLLGIQQKSGPFPDEEEKCVFFLWARKTKFSEAHRKKLSLFSTSTVKLALFWLKTQQLRWTTPLAHQELPCSCDKLDFWQPWLFHGRNKSGNIFPRIYWCRKNTMFSPYVSISIIISWQATEGFLRQKSCGTGNRARPRFADNSFCQRRTQSWERLPADHYVTHERTKIDNRSEWQ